MRFLRPHPARRRLALSAVGAGFLAVTVLASGSAMPRQWPSPPATFVTVSLLATPDGRSGIATSGATTPVGGAAVPVDLPADVASATPEPGVGNPGTEPPASSPADAPMACPSPPGDASPAPIVRHGSRAERIVALTFDDGWDAATTGRILAILERARVNATFFPVGLAMQRLPATWRQVAAAGFPIGDHTYDHRDLAGLCYPAQVSELERQTSIVASVLGRLPLPVMRPPYGIFDGTTRLAATSDGQAAIVLWDVDTRDWSGLSPAAIASRALAGEDGSIVLMHTFVENTALALPRIIAGYRARGFRFVTIGQLLGIPGPVPFP